MSGTTFPNVLLVTFEEDENDENGGYLLAHENINEVDVENGSVKKIAKYQLVEVGQAESTVRYVPRK